ncbi:MAG: depupylase/deamidase Dop [Candidatus Nanopelagicales bacterium]|nr:depupylase/deamidase Dop [Candidatus Nanopelagicales bacterium]
MTVKRIMGIETEYGITVPGVRVMNAMASSTRLVNAYARNEVMGRQRNPKWDYAEESPLRDARGFDMTRAEADPTQLTDDDITMANVILTNGARFYVDHAHPEYSSPEVTGPRDAVLWDRAGMVVMSKAANYTTTDGVDLPVMLYKNNTDNKGASYGTHENYLMNRATPFASIVAWLTPFFITRQIFTGAGRLGVGQESKTMAYQLSQRADFFEAEVGLETTFKRPIINTRDEPHCDAERFRRLHVIVGDANMSDTATYLKMGTTSLVLSMLESGFLSGKDLSVAEPIRSMYAVSHDVSLRQRVGLSGDRHWTAIEIQRELWEWAALYCEAEYGADIDPETRDVLALWGDVLDRLDRDPMDCADVLDWVAKLRLMEAYRTRDNLEWGSAQLQVIDLQYSDIRKDRGLSQRLEERGQLRRMFTDEQIERARIHPPEDTRAYFRGECLRKYPNEISAASWDSLVFDLPGRESLTRVPTLEPSRGTKALVEELLVQANTAEELIALLSA